MANIIVGAIVLVCVGLAVFFTVKSRKKGGCGCGCSGCSQSKSKGCR